MARDQLASVVTFGGGTALAAAYLHHRLSEDLDFFSEREVEQQERQVGHIDFAFYPFEPIDRPTRWAGLRVDSLLDMTVNKVQALLTRAKPRDYVDLHFLLKHGPETDLLRLLSYVRSKFGTGADPLSLAERFLRASEVRELPRMLKPVSLDELVDRFGELARLLTRANSSRGK